ncbi:TonB-dependent receptor [Alteromonas sp. C1M14]|nr:TonB-dependent receptor [Alteromonas sp. C1M14]
MVLSVFSVQAQQENNQDMESITVTAQKRVQSIQDVPMTMSAFDSNTLEDLGIDQFDKLSDFVPGLVVQQQSINNNGYVIRGITSDDGSASASARVSVYLNGTDVSRSRGSYFETYDMERIEVVKGPQATLFGTAASIGAISFVTAKPEQELNGYLKVSAGNYDMYEVQGMVTGGSETVQGRFAFVKKARDGYVKNNAEGENDLNGYDRQAYRASLRFTPNDDLTVDIIYNHDEASDPGTAFASEDVLFTDDGAFSVPDSTVLGMNDIGIEREVDDINLTVNWDLSPRYSLTYIGAYRDYDSLETFDADGTEYEFLSFAENATGDQTSQELRLNFTGDKLNGFIGTSYFTEDATQSVPFIGEEGVVVSCMGLLASYGIESCNTGTSALLTEGAFSELVNEGIYTRNTANNTSVSVFADASYAITPKFELTAGLRYVKESRETTEFSDMPSTTLISSLVGYDSTLFFTSTASNGITYAADADDSVLLPRLNALYTVNDAINVYATFSKGQRSQIVDIDAGALNLVPAEEISNYETGLKGRSHGGALTYSAAVFLQDYKNFQVSVYDGETGLSETVNAGSASNLGFEGEVSWNITDELRILANIAIMDAGIDDDEENGEYAGNQFRLQPKTSGALGYIYRTDMGNELTFFSSGSYTYRSSVYFDIENQYEEAAVALVNLQLGVSAMDDNWELTLAATNLLDNEYIMDAGNTGSSFGFATYIEGAPRMVSLNFTKRFGQY